MLFRSFILLSILSHIQILIFLAAYFFGKLGGFWKYLQTFSGSRIAISFFFVLLSLFFLQNQIVLKFEGYRNMLVGNLIANSWRTLVFLVFIVYFSNQKVESFLQGLTILLFSISIGPDRVVMMAFFIFIFYALKKNNGLSFPIIIFFLYYLFKSLNFLFSIKEYGHGFEN